MKNRVSKNLKKAELAIELVAMRQGIPVDIDEVLKDKQ